MTDSTTEGPLSIARASLIAALAAPGEPLSIDGARTLLAFEDEVGVVVALFADGEARKLQAELVRIANARLLAGPGDPVAAAWLTLAIETGNLIGAAIAAGERDGEACAAAELTIAADIEAWLADGSPP